MQPNLQVEKILFPQKPQNICVEFEFFTDLLNSWRCQIWGKQS